MLVMPENNRKVEILDTTLRDGSYTIGYQFTVMDTAIIARGLELSGIKRIEIGHGLGLGADRAGKGAQAVSDYMYMQACRGVLEQSIYGFFYMPDIGNNEDIELLVDEGGKFIRIGITPDDIERAGAVVKLAKKRGLEVWVNMMKSYAYPVNVCIECAKMMIGEGADGVYVVDSAGGMLPNEVAHYVEEITNALFIHQAVPRVGFHGHENLGLSVASSLAAVEAGGAIVDGSLLGIGRSMGNASTEGLAMVLKRAGYETGVDPWKAADLADRMVRPFLETRWRNNSIEQALGFSQIHSGFLALLEDVAAEKNVDLRDLILAFDANARLHITKEMAETAADLSLLDITDESIDKLHGLVWPHQSIVGPSGFINDLGIDGYVDEIVRYSKRMNKPSTLLITGSWKKQAKGGIKLQQIRILDSTVIGAIEITESDDLESTIKRIDGTIGTVFLDQTPRGDMWNKVLERIMITDYSTRIIPYADEIANIIACCRLVAIEAKKRELTKAAVFGDSKRFVLMTQLLPYWGISLAKKGDGDFMILVDPVDSRKVHVDDNVLVFDLLSDSLSPTMFESFKRRGVEVIRPDGSAAIVSEVVGMLESLRLTDETMGRFQAGEVSFVAGGVWGSEGEVVVNSAENPTLILGIADGNGMLKTTLNKDEEDALVAAELALFGKLPSISAKMPGDLKQ